MSLAELSRDKYNEFFKLAHAEGVLDVKTKHLLHIAVVLALRCEP
jgi:alkylhydroperoxidase/carboxymuconolactone decarboxylase family protein YurZ